MSTDIIAAGWFKVPNWIFETKHNLSPTEITVYLYMLKLSGFGSIWPTYDNIAERCKISKRVAIYTVKSLEDKGFLEKQVRAKGYKHNYANTYILAVPQQIRNQIKNKKEMQNLHSGDAESAPLEMQNLHSGDAESAPNKDKSIKKQYIKKQQNKTPDEQEAAKAAVSLQNKDMEEIRLILKEFDIKIGRNAKAERLLQVLNESYYQNCKDKNYIQAIGRNLQEHSKAGNIKNPVGLLISAADNPALMKDIIQGNLYKNGEATAAKNRQIQEEAKRRENDKEACQQALENNMPQILKAYRKRNQYSGQMPEIDVPGFNTLSSLDDADADDDETIGDKLEKQRNTHGFN